MSTHDDDLYDDDEYEQPETNATKQMRSRIKELEKQAKANAEAAARAEKLERELTVLRTPGLGNLTEKQMKALFAAHDGELNPDALTATAVDLGFAKAPEPEVPASEAAVHQRQMAAASGAVVPDGIEARDLYAAAKTQEEVLEIARRFGHLDTQG